eukprot:6590217-Pyramimonas_sp.AAC.1
MLPSGAAMATEEDNEEEKAEDLCQPKTHQRYCNEPSLQIPSSQAPCTDSFSRVVPRWKTAVQQSLRVPVPGHHSWDFNA